MENAEHRERAPWRRAFRALGSPVSPAVRARVAARRLGFILVAGGLLAPAVRAADAGLALQQLPVTGTRPVAAEHYRAAQEVATRGGTPVEIALSIAGPFEGATQAIVQVNAGAEVPSAARVAVLRDGLLDDAVGSERWDVTLRRTSGGAWTIIGVTRAWRCRRGSGSDRFDATLCP
jgi:hypothetical protein